MIVEKVSRKIAHCGGGCTDGCTERISNGANFESLAENFDRISDRKTFVGGPSCETNHEGKVDLDK